MSNGKLRCTSWPATYRASLDSKIRVLEMLIREANQTAARLDAALDKTRLVRSADREEKHDEQPATIQPASPARPGRINQRQAKYRAAGL